MADDIRSIYGKPLVRGTPLEDEADRTELLEETGDVAVEKIKQEIRRLSFKGSPTNLLESFEWEVKGKSTLVIKSDHPAAKYLDKGVKKYQMTHLAKSDRPIPIVKDNGEIIFRNATPQGMREGKWVHPGIRGKNFIERGVQKAREAVKERVKEEIKAEVMKRLKGG